MLSPSPSGCSLSSLTDRLTLTHTEDWKLQTALEREEVRSRGSISRMADGLISDLDLSLLAAWSGGCSHVLHSPASSCGTGGAQAVQTSTRLLCSVHRTPHRTRPWLGWCCGQSCGSAAAAEHRGQPSCDKMIDQEIYVIVTVINR